MIVDGTNLILNFLPITISGSSFRIYVSKFTSKESLKTLRQSYPNCVFHRIGSDVYCVPFSDGKTFGEERIIDVNENHELLRRLISDKILREILGTTRILTDFDSFVDVKKNYLSEISNYADNLAGMRLYPQITINVKTILNQNKENTFGVVVDAFSFHDIVDNVDVLTQKGVNVAGLFSIRKTITNIDGKNHRWKKFLGKIEKISNGTITLSHHQDQETVNASECHIEASKRNRIHLIRSLCGRDSDQVYNLVEKEALKIIGGKGKFEIIGSIAKEICAIQDTTVTPGLRFTIGKDFLNALTDNLVNNQIDKPTFVYNTARTETDTWHNRGLNTYGPFAREIFQHNDPKIIVITPNTYLSEVKKFLNVFQNGSSEKGYYKQGFVSKYHLSSIQQLDFVELDHSSTNLPSAYREACLSALEKGNYDLAIVIIEEKFRENHGDRDPYLVSKSVFMSHGIPVQEIEIETLRQGEKSWPYTLDNIALACYVKMGGTPWTLSTYEQTHHELVIGMGNAVIQNARGGKSERYVGITNVFSADGNYLLNNISREIGIENYKEELLESLKSLLNEISKTNAWKSGDNVRLIFHQQFKDFRQEDIDAIKEIVGQYKEYNIEFSFVRISEEHPYQIYDTNQNGVEQKYDRIYSNRGLMKGEYVPQRGVCIEIGPRTTLLCVTAPEHLITPLQGIPKPLQIALHRDSTFRDMNYIARQVYHFTFLNWRSFNPTSMPVTILYSDFIAGLLGKLKDVTNWNPDPIRTRLKLSRWFL